MTSRAMTVGYAMTACLLATQLGAPPAVAQTAQRQAAEAKKLRSERGATPIEANSTSDMFRNPRDREPYLRDFPQQPPLIPHTVKGYTITRNFNKCMDCHAWSKAKETHATRVSETHFKTRDQFTLANISPGRYFCLQCHVSQVEAAPLVRNDFVPLETLRTHKR